MSTANKFDYNEVSGVYNSIKGTVSVIKGDLETMNSGYEAVVQVPGGAIYGSLGAQMLLDWDNVSSSFPSFMNNFDNWGALIANMHGNYSELEQKVTGFREGNRFGYSVGLTQRGLQAMADSAYATNNSSEPVTVTREDALNEIKGNGTDPANQFAAASPIRSSEVAGYDSANLPNYRSLEVATGAAAADGTRSVVQSYTEDGSYERTASTVTEETPNEAAGRVGESTMGPVPDRTKPAEETHDVPDNAGTEDAGLATGGADDGAQADPSAAAGAPEGKGEIRVPETEGHGKVSTMTDVTDAMADSVGIKNDGAAKLILRTYEDGHEELIQVDPDNPYGVLVPSK